MKTEDVREKKTKLYILQSCQMCCLHLLNQCYIESVRKPDIEYIRAEMIGCVDHVSFHFNQKYGCYDIKTLCREKHCTKTHCAVQHPSDKLQSYTCSTKMQQQIHFERIIIQL